MGIVECSKKMWALLIYYVNKKSWGLLNAQKKRWALLICYINFIYILLVIGGFLLCVSIIEIQSASGTESGVYRWFLMNYR